MKFARRTIAIFGLLAIATVPAGAQSATQVVRFRVLVQQAAVVKPMPAPMKLKGRDAAVSTGSYGFAANEPNRKITASLDEEMPEGSSLAVTMTPPAGARSAGQMTLGTDAVDVVTAIPATQSSDLPVRYVVRAPDGLGSSAERVVTYTVTAAP